MPESILKKAGGFVKDSVLLLRPLRKKEKWDIGRLDTYLSPEEYRKVKGALKQGKVKIELLKLGFSFLISGKDVLPRLVSEVEFFQKINNKIEKKYYDKLFEEFSPRAYDVLFHYLASDVMYLADLKRAAILQLFTEFPLHVLIIGESDSGKSKILNSVRTLAPKSTYGIGSSISSSGLTLSVQGKNVKPGILPRADQGVCCISELNLIKKNELSQLVSVMDKGYIKYDKGGASIKKDARTKILATAETKKGDFKSYSLSQIKKQIPFNSSFLSKFHLIFITKKPSKNEFRIIADTIIDESVKKDISKDEIEFIKRYIDYSSGIRVKLPKKLAKQVDEFVVGLKDMEKKLPYNISSKTVEGIVSLIKASARSEFRGEVENKDLERVFSIVRSALQI
ncbi:MAG: hypothetical protein JSW73_01185 [Candidatus Woesearchaeota archaeon]|nr:MAG: hypothetical protein JSW73_01185 [Candidatus Woesearchaeota archaeon]